MRRSCFVWLCLFFAVSLSAQTVDEIIAKSLQARGGLTKLKAIQSIRITGQLEAMGMQNNFTRVLKRPLRMRTDLSLQGVNVVRAYDGRTGWHTGKTDPEVMGADELKGIQEGADFDGPLMDYQQKGNAVELLGKEIVNGKDTYHLKVTLKNGDTRHFYLDIASFLTLKSVLKTTMAGSEVEFPTVFLDYKQVDGIMFPFSVVQDVPQGEITEKITKVEINVPIDDAIFKMPAAAPPATGSSGNAAPKNKKPGSAAKPPQN